MRDGLWLKKNPPATPFVLPRFSTFFTREGVTGRKTHRHLLLYLPHFLLLPSHAIFFVHDSASEPMSGLKHAFHWFDCPTFYQQVKWLLKKPNGVLAVWCGMLPRINDSIDAVLDCVYAESEPFFAPPRKMVDDEYRSFEFPFGPFFAPSSQDGGTEHTGPFEFEANLSMDLDSCLTLVQSWSAYQTALQKGVDLLREEVVEDFKCAWGGED